MEQNAQFQAHGLLASAWLRQAGPDRAARHVQPAMEACHAGAWLGFAAQAGFVGVAEVLFALEARGGREGQDAARKLRRWLRLLRIAAFGRPVLEPWDLYFRASWQRVHGLRMVAVRRLRRAIRLADRMNLAYEAGAARVELGRLLRTDDPERRETLSVAGRILEEIGAASLLTEARSLAGAANPQS